MESDTQLKKMLTTERYSDLLDTFNLLEMTMLY